MTLTILIYGIYLCGLENVFLKSNCKMSELDLSYIKDNFENPNADIKKYIAQESELYLYDVE